MVLIGFFVFSYPESDSFDSSPSGGIVSFLAVCIHLAKYHGLIKLTNYIDTIAKRRHLKKCTRDFAAGIYLSEAPFPPRFLFRVV
jgi:hypothetical protein